MQVVLLCAAQRGLALFLPVFAGVIYVIQKVYLRTSRQLRYLELESRAAVLTRFLESVSAEYLPTLSIGVVFLTSLTVLIGRGS